MSEKEAKTPLKDLLGKENPSTLLKFILAILGMLASIGTAILWIPNIDLQTKLLMVMPFYGSFFYLLITTYNDAKKDPFRYIANSNTFIQFLNNGLGDSYKKNFYNSNEKTEFNTNAPLQIDDKSDIELIEPVKTKNLTKKLTQKK